MTTRAAYRFLKHMRPYRTAFVTAFAAALATAPLALGVPWVLKRAIDDLAAGGGPASAGAYSVAFVLIVAGTCVFRYVNRQAIAYTARRAERDIRSALFAHLQRLDLAYYQGHRVGDLMSRATNDLNAVGLMIGPAMTSSTEVITVLLGLVLMASIDWQLTLLALVPLPAVFFVSRFHGRKIHAGFAAMQTQFGEMSSVLHESLAGIRMMRAYCREDWQVARFAAANGEYLRRSRSPVAYQSVYLPSALLLVGVGSALVLYFGARELVSGSLTIGELVALQAYLTMLTWPVMSFGYSHNLVRRGLASWERILQLLDAKPSVEEPAVAATMPLMQVGSVEVRDLTFAFGARVVLRDVSAVLPHMKTTAIVGASGSGKSTLLALIARLSDPPDGTVFVGGRDVRKLPLATLRGAIAFVSQDPFLFGTTIANNIAFGVEGGRKADRARVERAAEIACLDADVAMLPNGYDTVIGERGITLSGGQRQRVAIARAVICDRPILVLDDALSAVDVHTEREVLRRLRASMRSHTLIVVSHRVSAVRGADQILVLDEGRIVERGTHDELVRFAGVYQAFDRRQQLMADLAVT